MRLNVGRLQYSIDDGADTALFRKNNESLVAACRIEIYLGIIVQ